MRFFWPLLLILVGISLPGRAQKYEIEISKLQLIKPIKSYYLAEIIDLREDKSKIGVVHRSMNNEKIAATFAKSIPEEIQATFKNNSKPAPDAIPVILKVNKLQISEYLSIDQEVANAEFAFEFLVKKDSTYYKILESGCQHELKSNIDVTGKHGKNILYVLLDCFGQLKRINIPEKLKDAPAFGPDYLKLNTYYNPDFSAIPILYASNYTKGVYRNFLEFKNNTPFYTDVVFTKSGVEDKNGSPIKDFWGYSNGTTIFLKHGPENYLYPLQKEGNTFIFKAHLVNSDRNAVLAGALLGGMTGALIASAITEKHAEIDLVLNPITGQVTEVSGYGPTADLGIPHTLTIYRKAKNETPQPVTIMMNDSVYARLAPNSFAEIKIDIPKSGIKIFLDDASSKYQIFNPITTTPHFLEVSNPVKSAAAPMLTIAPEQEATYYLKIIKHNAAKSKKEKR